MFEIVMYQDARGIQPVQEFIDGLQAQAEVNKTARVRFNKIAYYMRALREHGTYAGEPYTKHIEGRIWELRPTSDRILYFCNVGREIVFLHHFHKKTRKTPRQEIEQALRNMQSHLKEKDHETT